MVPVSPHPVVMRRANEPRSCQRHRAEWIFRSRDRGIAWAAANTQHSRICASADFLQCSHDFVSMSNGVVLVRFALRFDALCGRALIMIEPLAQRANGQERGGQTTCNDPSACTLLGASVVPPPLPTSSTAATRAFRPSAVSGDVMKRAVYQP